MTWDANENDWFTLVMIDPDAPSREIPSRRHWRHWLVTNISGGDAATGEELTAYAGPSPGSGSGPHRYVFILYKQPAKLEFEKPSKG